MGELSTELRRLLASYLARLSAKATPADDLKSLRAFEALFLAMRLPEQAETITSAQIAEDAPRRTNATIDAAEANIREDHRAGKTSKEQFQTEMLIVARARRQAIADTPPQTKRDA